MEDAVKEITDVGELRQIELEILDNVAKFCDERGIKWFLIGGTLIGAVRHKGFVPWDDDIDIGMLRPDYERFVTEFPDSGMYAIRTAERGTYMYPYAKVVDTKTAVREKDKTARNLGVWIDIFPFDGVPSKDCCPSLTRKWRWIKQYSFTRNLPVFAHGRKLARKIGVWATLPLRVFPNNVAALALKKIAMRHSVENSPYIGILVWGYGLREIIPRKAFDGMDWVEFEGRKLPAMSGWDLYLSTVYGDYMTPPPPEKRKSTHDFEAWWK